MRNLKMKAYAPDEHQYKFKATPDARSMKITRQEKLIVRNANRALKKSVRRNAKLEIRRALESDES